jgi:hypothetical protein
MSLVQPGYMQRDSDYYVTDFGEYSIGGLPGDWTSRYSANGTVSIASAAGSMSGKAMHFAKAGAIKQLVSWNKVPIVPDMEILMRTRNTNPGSLGNAPAYIAARASGTAGAANLYGAEPFEHSSSTTLYRANLNKWVGGTFTSNVIAPYNGPPPNWVSGTWFWMRYRLSGNSHSIKVWLDGSSEPGSFGGTATDSSITTGGWTGLYCDTSLPDADIDFFSVALRGKTAPSSKR